MKTSFSRSVRSAALGVFLGVYAMSNLASAIGGDWQTLMEKSTLLSMQGQHEQTVEVAREALDIADSSPIKNEKNVALSLFVLASAYRELAQYDKALPHYHRMLKIIEPNFGPEHPDTMHVLDAMAFCYMASEQHEQALSLYLRILAIREKKLGREHLEVALSLGSLAVIYTKLVQYEKAPPLLERALSINEKALGPEHPDSASHLYMLAGAYSNLAQYDKALPLELRALAIREKTLGPEHPDTAASLDNLATTYLHLAQYEKALPLQQRALAIHEKVLGSEHPGTALSLNNLAGTYSNLGQYDVASQLWLRALTIREKVLGPEHPLTVASLANVASAYGGLSQNDQALPLELRALEITERTLGSEHPDTALRLNNLAATYIGLAEYEKAQPLQQRALAIREKTLGPEHPDTALSLNNLAVTYDKLSKHYMALPLQQRALAIREKVLGPKHIDTASSLRNLAGTLKFMRQSDLAIAFFKASVNVYQSQRERVSRIDETALRSYTDSVAITYQELAELLVDQGRLADAQLVLDMLKENEQFEFIRRSSSADPRLTRIGYNSNEQIWMSRYRQIADRLAALGLEEQVLKKQEKFGLSAGQKQRQQALVADLRVAQAAFDSFLKEIRESFDRQGPAKAVEASATSQSALRELQNLIKGLGPDAVLLQYYVTDDKVGMLLTTPGVQLARNSNVSAKDLNRQIAEYRRALRDPKADAKKLSQALYQLLVAPVAQDLEQAGAKTVMLSLDGALRYLPFAALHDGNRYLVQRWNLPMYTSVTKNRLLDDPMARWQGAGLGVTKAVGQFTALPAVRNEMRSIFKAASNGVLPGEIYLDEAFTAQRFKDISQRPLQLLHVASHFLFSPGTEIHSFLLLGDGQKLTLGDIRTQNYRFDHLDLLTLSACDTGLGGGRDATGREIEGFGVIAQQQGAKAVLATLWPVADDSTAKLMAEMYRRRQDNKLTKMESLRQAQLSLLEQTRYEHPFYWAPFILMGNWK